MLKRLHQVVFNKNKRISDLLSLCCRKPIGSLDRADCSLEGEMTSALIVVPARGQIFN